MFQENGNWHLPALNRTVSWPRDPSLFSTSVGTPNTRCAFSMKQNNGCYVSSILNFNYVQAMNSYIRAGSAPSLCDCDYVGPRIQRIAIPPCHLAPSGAKKEQAFAGVILKRERHSGPLYAHSGPHFPTLEHKNEVLSLQNGRGACKWNDNKWLFLAVFADFEHK